MGVIPSVNGTGDDVTLFVHVGGRRDEDVENNCCTEPFPTIAPLAQRRVGHLLPRNALATLPTVLADRLLGIF